MVIFWVFVFLGLIQILRSPNFWQNKNSLNVFIWPQSIDTKILKNFEEKTGIILNVSYYESNEELFAKIKRTEGKGYDLIIPSDYAIDLLIKEGLLKRIDHSKLNFWKQINPSLLNKYYDLNNMFSIPFELSIYGIGFNSNAIKKGNVTEWRDVFSSKSRVVMPNDIRELIFITSQYLFGKHIKMEEQQVLQVISVLNQQKKFVEAYTDFQADKMLSNGSCELAISSSLFIWQGMRRNKDINFVIPKDGSFVSIENIAIPKGSCKDFLIYQLINYLFELETITENLKKFSALPVLSDIFDKLKISSTGQITNYQIGNADFFKDEWLSEEHIDKVLLELKS